jgi:hypothetical protein
MCLNPIKSVVSRVSSLKKEIDSSNLPFNPYHPPSYLHEKYFPCTKKDGHAEQFKILNIIC